jgi:glycosyltransferase involved in cell wall biosynthesis
MTSPVGKLRVAMVTDHPDREDMVDGGVQAVTKYLLHGLVKSGEIEVHVLSFKYGVKAGTSLPADGYFRHVLPGARFGTLTSFRKDQQTLTAHLDRIRPLIVHGQGAGHNGILARRSKYPSVITIHEIMTEEAKYYSGHSDRMRHLLTNRLSTRHCIQGGQHTILISPYVADFFGATLEGKKYLIPNPIADEFFLIDRNEDPKRVLFAGRLTPRKGVEDLIAAASIVAQSAKIKLILAGSLADQQYVRQLRNEINQRRIQAAVQFCGLLNEQKLREELGRAAVLVLPSYQETAPMVVGEAMAAGVPVIASDVGGIRYQVKHGETGFLIEAGDRETLARRLVALLLNSDLRESLGTAARLLATDEYRTERVARKTIAVYRSILRNPL